MDASAPTSIPDDAGASGEDATLVGDERAPRSPSFTRPQRVGRLVVLDRIGTGSMGVVFSAYDEQLDRRVALKFLLHHGGALSEKARERLVREAQAMGRLNHPNVLTVHDIGEHDGRIYLAMELVNGQTLEAWLGQHRRWDEILDVVVAAGRGLAAAHAEGIVHRDFKPANIIVDDTGRPRVGDFGLARLTEPSTASASAGDDNAPQTSNDGRSTTIAGTPLYMAPELHDGQPADSRSDQFAFCVVAYEALFGQHPFAGTTAVEKTAAMAAGRVRTPTRGRGVPARIRNAVLRGLDAEPTERWPSMDALLDELERRRTWRTRTLPWLALAAVAGVAAWLGSSSAQTDCDSADALHGVWDEDARARVHAAFARSGAEFANDTWAYFERELDTYTQTWAAAHRDACEATHVRREQPLPVFHRRMACLSARREELGAVVRLLGREDDPDLSRVPSLVQNLVPIDRCSTSAAVEASLPDPATAAAAAEIYASLAEVRALATLGRWDAAGGQALGVLERAEALGQPEVLARARLEAGLTGRTLHPKRSAALRRQAYFDAVALGDHVLAVQAATQLARDAAVDRGNLQEALVWADHARRYIELGDLGPGAEARLLLANGAVYETLGWYPEAVETLAEGMSVIREDVAGDDLFEARMLTSYGAALGRVERNDEALAALDRALQLTSENLGEEHPRNGDVLNNRAVLLQKLGRAAEAERSWRRALELWGDWYPTGFRARVWLNLGQAMYEAERWSASREAYNKAIALLDSAETDGEGIRAIPLTGLGAIFEREGKPEEAERLYRRALALGEETLGIHQVYTQAARVSLLTLLAEQGRYEEARELGKTALAAGEDSIQPEDLRSIASALWALGEHERARELIERARARTARAGETSVMEAFDRWLDAHPLPPLRR